MLNENYGQKKKTQSAFQEIKDIKFESRKSSRK